ncbi:MAG: Spermidine/putrescine import ATP-binding protein PotA [Alphaproteobacteria bacterium MarineAlpha3_Bin5]|nr:MAG: Spermidine/putrescine import ATP-binding protein PotA [Alphaproteobacteria bacterium MarineAlpha3_Bin5]
MDALPIKIRSLTKTYGSIYALKSVDLNINSGEFLTLLGPSGSGKTTLLMAVAGFSRPDAGSVLFGEKEMVLSPPHKRDVGMVFQNYALFPHMTVAENIAFPLKLRKIKPKEQADQVNAALATVQLTDYSKRKIDQLSGGQRQRVALARAFVFKPRILLMDEPLAALDKKLREQMQIELKQLHRQLGVTTVYVTHDQREALTMSDRVAVINEGEIIQIGTPEQIYSNPKNSFVADFIGESTILPLTPNNRGDLCYSDSILYSAKPEFNNKNWALVIRPERLFPISNSENPKTSITFEGKIMEFVFQGESTLGIIQLPNSDQLTIRISPTIAASFTDFKTGQTIMVGLNHNDKILIPAN